MAGADARELDDPQAFGWLDDPWVMGAMGLVATVGSILLVGWLARRVITVMLQPMRLSFSHTWRPTKPVPPKTIMRFVERVMTILEWLEA